MTHKAIIVLWFSLFVVPTFLGITIKTDFVIFCGNICLSYIYLRIAVNLIIPIRPYAFIISIAIWSGFTALILDRTNSTSDFMMGGLFIFCYLWFFASIWSSVLLCILTTKISLLSELLPIFWFDSCTIYHVIG